MYKIFIFILMLLPFWSRSQVRGHVYGGSSEKPEPLYNARVEVARAGLQMRTSEEGYFEFVLPKTLPDTLFISASGYYPDTVVLEEKDRFSHFKIQLLPTTLLPEMVVEIKRDSKSVSRLKTLLVETLNTDELKKAACCNLSESFETNASVDVSLTDAVSGTKQIQMMGLAGVYTQIQLENIPYLRGLESTFGLNSIPGTWINSIQITKGSGSVVNGPESMAGLINLDFQHPVDMPLTFVNVYGNQMGRAEVNVQQKINISPKLTSGLFVHGSALSQAVDGNRDGFKDLPTYEFATVHNRWQYQGKKMEAQWGLTGYLDNRVGGQLDFRDSISTPALYGLTNHTRHLNAYAKTGFLFKRPVRSIGVLYNVKRHETSGQIGRQAYAGLEERGYVNVIYDDYIGSTIHKFRNGISFTAVRFNQHIDSVFDNRTELVPGVFSEYTYTGLRLVAVAGLRVDHHNLFGWIPAPRLHAKYILTEKTDLRFSAGRGWRVPNYQSEYFSQFVTGRTWVRPQNVQPEISWNVGGSVAQEWKMWKRKNTLVVDYFYTWFENQLVVDRDASPEFLIFNYVQDRSFSHSVQAEWSVDWTKWLSTRVAYKYLNVQSEFGGILQPAIMVPKHRGFFNYAIATRNKKWKFDQTVSIFGPARLPVNRLPDGTFTTNNESEIYPMISAQLTYIYKFLEVYVGGENLANYTQDQPIIDAQQPFGATFDATRVWAPIYGTMIYAGMRLEIKSKNKNQNNEKL